MVTGNYGTQHFVWLNSHLAGSIFINPSTKPKLLRMPYLLVFILCNAQIFSLSSHKPSTFSLSHRKCMSTFQNNNSFTCRILPTFRKVVLRNKELVLLRWNQKRRKCRSISYVIDFLLWDNNVLPLCMLEVDCSFCLKHV